MEFMMVVGEGRSWELGLAWLEVSLATGVGVGGKKGASV